MKYLDEETGKIVTITTNGDRIRSMTDEELACFMRDRVGCKGCPRYPCTLNTSECLNAWLQWSQEEIRI